MTRSGYFEIQCVECGTAERLTFRAMKTRAFIRCIFCGTVLVMGADVLAETCRDAAIATTQRH